MSLAGAYNGFTFGGATAARVSKLDGLFDLDGVVSNDLPKSAGHGLFPGNDRTGGRSILLGLTLMGGTEAGYITLATALADATEPEDIPDELPLQLLGNTLYVMARPRRRTIPIDALYRQTSGLATVQFFCSSREVFAGTPPP